MITLDLKDFIFTQLEYKKMDTAKLKKHIHPSYEILFVTQGEIEYVIEDNYYTLKSGDLLLIKPATYHFVRNISKAPYKRFCIQFIGSFVKDKELADEVYSQGEMFTLPKDSAFERIMLILSDLIEATPKDKIETVCNNLLHTLLISLINLNSKPSESRPALSKSCQKIYEYVDLNLATIKSIEDISNALFFSKSYINHTFKDNFNIGVMQYIKNKRILTAHQLITNGENPTNVYQKCGFSSYIAFYRAYKQYFSESPAKAKKRATPPPEKN